MRTDRIVLALFSLGLIAAVSGCPGSLDNKADFLDGGLTTSTSSGSTGSGGVDPCGDVPAVILAAKCGGSGCHGVKAPQNDLDLESPGVAARVLDHPAKLCSGILAKPSDPANSVIYTKVLEANTCGARMPLARPVLSPKEEECIKTWIGNLGGGTSTGAGGAGGSGGAASSSASSSGSAGGK